MKCRSTWQDYKSYELIFENIDPLLGGRPTEEGRVVFPRKGDKIILPKSWFNGWFRDNQAMINERGLHNRIGWGTYGEFIEPPDLKDITLKVKEGLKTYEAVMPGGKFKELMRFPFKGSKIQNEEQLRLFFARMAVAPIRGFAGNAKALGGRIMLLEMNKSHRASTGGR